MAGPYTPFLDEDPDAPFILKKAVAAARGAPAPAPMAPGVPAPGSTGDLMRQITERMNQRPDEGQLVNYAKQRNEEANRNFLLGTAMSMGGSAFAPAGAQVLKQALAQQGDYEIPGGWGRVHQGGVVWNPAKQQEADLSRLTTLYGIQERADTQRQTQQALDAYRQQQLAQGKFIPIKDENGNVTAVVNAHTGEVVRGTGAQQQPVDALPRHATQDEKNRYGNAAEVITIGNRIIKDVDANKDAFGLGTGSAAMIGAATGVPVQKLVLTPEQEQVRAGVMQKAYEVIKTLAGTALSATEAARIMQFAPNPRDNADTITAKLKSAIKLAHETRGVLQQRYGMQGAAADAQAPPPAAAQPSPSALPQATVAQRAAGYYNTGGSSGGY